jgi:hypothetical protein
VSAGSPWASLTGAARTLEQVSMNPLAPPLRLAEAAGVLSLATDLAMGQPLEHGLRTAMLALRLARTAGTWHGRKTWHDHHLQGDSQRRKARSDPGADGGAYPRLAPRPDRQAGRDPALTVSVITYQDGAQDLEVLHGGPPHHTEQTIDSDRFTRQHAETLPVAEPPDVRNAVALVRSLLLDDTAP